MMCIGRIEISIVRLILATNAAAFAKEPGWVMMYGMGKQGDNIGGEDINLADDVDWENGDDKGYPEDDPAQGHGLAIFGTTLTANAKMRRQKNKILALWCVNSFKWATKP